METEPSPTSNIIIFLTFIFLISFNREFIDVMKKRLIRGLDSKRELGFVNKFSALTTCAYEAYTPENVKVFFETLTDASYNRKQEPKDVGQEYEGQFK